MLVIPAIDLKDHEVVRLSQGKMGEAKVYSQDPLTIAKKWIDQGATRLHLVDLNGAFEGKTVHFDEVKKISKKFPEIEIEIGGGIRSLKTIEQYIDCGVSYCILGTVAIKDSDLFSQACQKFSRQIILGLDAKNGMVSTEGWEEVSQLSALDAAKRFKDHAVSAIIYTDVAKDGMMKGMNFSGIGQMAKESPFPIIASGGLTSLEDIKALKKIPNVYGVIAGKALYEGNINLEEAIEIGG